ncbi:metal-dependent transcriptional regulator [Lachnoclostridium sp. An118]|uniref:metal-dependent transcriptional regulator n=1 Tax=Lachnoclostridium sp. An118 TaxID=1965547 RepID=UPI000B3A5C0D|nr:metal-dependent transcriptional regulator [Lachnoclostridium sp. An118]OUQ51356.1 iron-dependent transcriptional regulator [Lachnoclostridium sp. An118]
MKPVITPSGEDYLETILVLQKKLGMVRSVDVARHMEVSKPSVCHAVSILEQGGFLIKDEDHFLRLTEKGREAAEAIYERHCYFKNWLMEAGVEDATAEQEACRIEHDISEQSFQKLKRWKELGHSEETNGD